MGVGCGILFPALILCVQAGQKDEDVAIATSTFVFLRSLGQTFGVAIGGLIFQNQWNKNLANLITTKSIPATFQIDGRQAESAVLYLKTLPPSELNTVKQIYSDSLLAVWIFYIPLAGVTFVASLFMKNYTLNKTLNSKQAFEGTRNSKQAFEETSNSKQEETGNITETSGK